MKTQNPPPHQMKSHPSADFQSPDCSLCVPPEVEDEEALSVFLTSKNPTRVPFISFSSTISPIPSAPSRTSCSGPTSDDDDPVETGQPNEDFAAEEELSSDARPQDKNDDVDDRLEATMITLENGDVVGSTLYKPTGSQRSYLADYLQSKTDRGNSKKRKQDADSGHQNSVKHSRHYTNDQANMSCQHELRNDDQHSQPKPPTCDVSNQAASENKSIYYLLLMKKSPDEGVSCRRLFEW